MLANSTLYQKGQNSELLPTWTESIGGTDIPLVILGDPAYPLLSWLMKAFPDNGKLSPQQKLFTYRLSHARVIVEHAYGRLKGRWRCLLKRLDVSVRHVPELVAACCVLHNMCEVHGDLFDDSWLKGTDNCNNTTTADHSLSQPESAANIHEALMLYFQSITE